MFGKRRKGNNKGFSLIELVCAVAIFGLSTAVIGGAMVVSSQSYQRGTIELDVQKEAQSTTNLVGNLLVDAVNVEATAVNHIKVTDKTGATYEVKQVGTELKYVQGSEEVVLAENVAYFKVDADDFNTSKNVEIDLAISTGGKEYKAAYNTTARNGQMDPSAAMEAKIFIDNEVVLEPGQAYNFTALVSSSVDVEGLDWNFVDATDATKATFISTSDTNAIVKLNPGAEGQIAFTVKTNKTKVDDAGNTVPLAIETVVIKVRRVTDITGMNHTVVSGTEYMAGAVYRVYAQVGGDNLDKQIGKAFDSDYINPGYVNFEVESSDITIQITDSGTRTTKENGNNPYIEFKLTEDLPVGESIVIRGTAKHPEGWIAGETDASGNILYNKASTTTAQYDYGDVTELYTIENTLNGPWPGASGLKRGDRQYWCYSDTSIVEEAKSYVAVGNQYKVYVRSWTKGTTPPPDSVGWIPMNTTSDLHVQFQEDWSKLFDPNVAYTIEMMLLASNTSTPASAADVVWPVLSGPDITPRNKYITRFDMDEAEVKYKCEELDVYSYVENIGTDLVPKELTATTTFTFDVAAKHINYQVVQNDVTFTVRQKDPINGWVSGSGISFQSQGDDNGETGFFSINGQNATKGVLYEIKIGIDFPQSTYNPTTKAFSYSDVTYDIGTMYVIFK